MFPLMHIEAGPISMFFATGHDTPDFIVEIIFYEQQCSCYPSGKDLTMATLVFNLFILNHSTATKTYKTAIKISQNFTVHLESKCRQWRLINLI